MVRRIFTMGGGGFSMEPENPALDDFLLSVSRNPRRPKICFVPTASGDNEGYISHFTSSFGNGRAEPSVLSLFNREHADLREFVLGQDVIYVGGGSTANLLVIWRAHGLDGVLREAYDDGVVLAGISAGMNCWFEASVTDSFGPDLAPLHDGLGFLPGSACPHYDGEEHRAGTFRGLVASGFPAGHAADDGCGLLFEEGELTDVVTSRPKADGYYVQDTEDGPRETPLGARYLLDG